MSIIRPYGDTTGDGMVQTSFTLPIPHSKHAEGAALQLANKMGMDPALVVHAKPMGPDFTFFVVYGRVNHLVDTDAVEVVERDYPLLTPKEVNVAVKRALSRRLVVVGACIGTDAHTVGIDAILNIKGFAGEKGLEYYRELKVVNLGAQVSVPQLVARANDEKADAVLVSQVVTQRDAHLLNTREMSAAFREAYPPATSSAARGRRPALRRGDGRRARRGPGVHPRHDAGRGGIVPGPPARREGGVLVMAEVGAKVTHRRYVPYSHAHYAGSLVDGAYGLGLFGDVATDLCIQTDGDEGLFAVLRRRPVPRAGARRRRGRGDRRAGPGRLPVAGHRVHPHRRGAGRADRRRPGAARRTGPAAGRDHRDRHRRRPAGLTAPELEPACRGDTPSASEIRPEIRELEVNCRCPVTCEDARSRRSRDG